MTITPQQVYKEFLLKVNKNDTNKNIKVPKNVFVLLFNEQKNVWLDSVIQQYESSDYIETIAELLEQDVKLTRLSENANKDQYATPADFYDKVSSYSLASQGNCAKQVLVNWFIKPKDVNVLLQNSNHSPSFDYRETIAVINKDGMAVYKDGFTLDDVFLTYYRNPIDLDIAGYTTVDGANSSDVSTDLDDWSVREVINLVAAEALKNYGNIEQLAIQTKK